MQWNPFRRPPRQGGRDQEIRDLEERAAGAAPAYQAQYLSRAGDLSASDGEMDRALHLWGRAIDCYLDNARPDAAAAACRKVIRHVPDVVRARRTLALLSIGQGRFEEALSHVKRYVEAAREANRTDLAVKLLQIMASATHERTVKRRIEAILAELDPDAARTRGGRKSSQGEAARDETEHERWSIILRAARMTPEEIERL